MPEAKDMEMKKAVQNTAILDSCKWNNNMLWQKAEGKTIHQTNDTCFSNTFL
jgi:hypothetical protein